MKNIYFRSLFKRIFLFNIFIYNLISYPLPTYASEISISCNEALQVLPLQTYMKAAQVKVAEELKKAPHPNFIDPIEDSSIQRTGEEIPETLKIFASSQKGVSISALKTPSVNAEHPAVVARFIPSTGVSAHLELESEGKILSTQVYFNMPLLTTSQQLDSEYLFSPKKGHKVMIYHGHGGGTPMAESMNGSSVALHTVKHGIPFMAVDQHSHGKGPNEPLLSYDEKIEYNLRILEKTVHPDVKIILSGHSWGGEDLLYFWTQYFPKHKNGRFKQILSQIIGVMPLSPPADVAMGSGSARKRVEIEDRLFREMAEDPTFDSRVAEKDKEFLKNILRSGKSSVTALWKTILTQIFLDLPLPSEEQIKDLPKIKIYQGKWDGLVYVGREFAFKPWQDLLKENFVLMDRFDTQREKNVEQGHQTFDAIDEAGRPVVYSGIVGLAEQELGESFPEIPYDAKGNIDTIPNLHRLFVQYMSFFPAREFFLNRQVVVPIDVPQGVQIVKLRLLLEEFTKGLAHLREENQKQFSERMKQRITQLSRDYSIRGGDEDGAFKELDMDPPSPSRRKHLQEFVEEASRIEKETFKHRVFENDEEAQAKVKKFSSRIENEYKTYYSNKKEVLKKGEKLSDYEPLEKTVNLIVSLEEGKNSLKSLFSNKEKIPDYELALDEVVNRYDLKKFLAEDDKKTLENIEQALKDVRNSFVGPADFKKERNSRIEKILQHIKVSRREFNQQTHSQVVEMISHINPSLGVTSIKEAKWELEVDFSEERRLKVHEFLAKVEDLRRETRKEFQMDLDAKVAEFHQQQLPKLNAHLAEFHNNKVPYDFKSEVDVRRKVHELQDIERQHYVVEGSSAVHVELKKLAGELKKKESELDHLKFEKEELLKTYNIKDLLKHKNTLLRKLEELFEKSHVADGPEKWTEDQRMNPLQITEDSNAKLDASQEVQAAKVDLEKIDSEIAKIQEEVKSQSQDLVANMALNAMFDDELQVLAEKRKNAILRFEQEKTLVLMPRWWPKEVRKNVLQREKALAEWKILESSLAGEIFEYMLGKFEEHGRFVEEDFTKIPESIRIKMQQYKVLRDNYFKEKQAVLDAFFIAMRTGDIPAPHYPNLENIPNYTKTKEHLNTLIGSTDLEDFPILFDPNSIEGKLRVAEQKMEDILVREAQLKAQISYLRYRYNVVLKMIDPSLVVKEYRLVNVGKLIQMGPESFLSQLQGPHGDAIAKALHIAIKEWEELWKEAVHETQIANPEWYPLNPEYYRAASGDPN